MDNTLIISISAMVTLASSLINWRTSILNQRAANVKSDKITETTESDRITLKTRMSLRDSITLLFTLGTIAILSISLLVGYLYPAQVTSKMIHEVGFKYFLLAVNIAFLYVDSVKHSTNMWIDNFFMLFDRLLDALTPIQRKGNENNGSQIQ